MKPKSSLPDGIDDLIDFMWTFVDGIVRSARAEGGKQSEESGKEGRKETQTSH